MHLGVSAHSLGAALARLLWLFGTRVAAPGGSSLSGVGEGPPGTLPLRQVLELAASKVRRFRRL